MEIVIGDRVGEITYVQFAGHLPSDGFSPGRLRTEDPGSFPGKMKGTSEQYMLHFTSFEQ